MMKLIMQSVKWGALVLILSLSSCQSGVFNCIKGDGSSFTETRNFSEFESIEINGSYDVELVQDSTFVLKIEGEKNLIPFVSSEVKSGELQIETRDGYCLNPSKTIQLTIGVKDLDKVELNGSGNILSDRITNSSLRIDLDGSRNISIETLTVDYLECEIAGSVDLDVEGTTINASYEISGSGGIEARSMDVRDVDV